MALNVSTHVCAPVFMAGHLRSALASLDSRYLGLSSDAQMHCILVAGYVMWG